jgi:Protein of unknown function (DUF3788)
MGASGAKPKKRTAAVFDNAFAGKRTNPNDADLAVALGPAKGFWDELVHDLTRECGIDPEWGSSSVKAGWSLRLKLKERIIVYLIPNRGSVQVALVLGDKAVKVARQSALPAHIRKMIGEARRYAEGTGVRITVQGREDVAAIRQLARIKMEH